MWKLRAIHLLNLLILLVDTSSSLDPDISPDLQPIPNNNQVSICGDIEIWSHSDEDVNKLRNCTVVEGYVRLMQLEASQDLEFPHLREVTGYILVFRVSGFDSLGQLFPNLAIIRGHTLFGNFALIVAESFDLKTIGLTSLRRILNGKVWIASNINLCFVNTVDWSSIVSGVRKDYFEGNKNSNECPVCGNCTKSVLGKAGCWSPSECQSICPSSCSDNCDRDGECCHPSCIGGCWGPGADKCHSCKFYRVGNNCTESCPTDSYVYSGWRCVNELECYSFPKTPSNQFWKPHDGKCVLNCPSGYHEEEAFVHGSNRFRCQKCEGGFCRKECNGASIKNKNDSVLMSGCTVVRGSVVISLSGSGKDIVPELENNLNSIEEITGLLKISDSYQLTSLNFLKNLRYIHGYDRFQTKYSLVVVGNKNLELLWDFDNKGSRLKINGSVYFRSNPKLCVNKIQRLLDESDILASDAYFPNTTNGVKSVCNLKELVTSVKNVSSNGAYLTWSPFQYHDLRKLLGYVVYIKEAAFRNVTVFDGRSECGGGGWTMYDVDCCGTGIQVFNLSPYTRYAFYVKTVTINADFGAQSAITYFDTLPGIPKPPSYVNVETNSSSELVVTWPPPAEPNGELSHYLVSIYELDDKSTLNDAVQNHCEGKDAYFVPSNNSRYSEASDKFNNYSIRHYISQFSDEERARQTQVAMLIEDKMNNYIYVKHNRSKRNALFLLGSEQDLSTFSPLDASDRFQLNNKSKFLEKENEGLLFFPDMNKKDNTVKNVTVDKVINSTGNNSVMSWYIKDLNHFTKYRVVVKACRRTLKEEVNIIKSLYCSDSVEELIKTCPSAAADSIPDQFPLLEVSSKEPGTVTLKWDVPENPNGLILSYTVEYKRSGYNPITENVNQYEFLKSQKSYVLKKLRAGNYSIRVRASSSSGPGPYTSSKYFYIKDETSFHSYIYLILGTLLFILPPAIAYCVYYLRKTEKNKLFISVNPEYTHKMYVADAWEIPRNQIDVIKEIGQGSFGMVYEGLLNNKPCAVKTVNAQASEGEKKEFLNEASVMKAFDTYHVVKLLGVVSLGEPVYVIMELMPNGDLKSFLRSHRPDVCDPHVRPPSVRRLLQMSAEIADGMSYLSAKKYVHRDLAARNCMVAENLTVKIGDFGMARDIYIGDYYRKGTRGLMPVRWMAPESLRDGIFLSASDVWSYGVVLYEMVTLAAQPYQGLTNDQVLRYVMDGGVMERPENCPDKIFDLMRRCWRQNPSNRPGFLDIVEELHQDVSLNFHAVSFYDSEQGKQHRRLTDLNLLPINQPF